MHIAIETIILVFGTALLLIFRGVKGHGFSDFGLFFSPFVFLPRVGTASFWDPVNRKLETNGIISQAR